MPKARHQQINEIGLESLIGGIQLTDRYTVAQLPAASAANQGFIVYVTNGAAGNPTIAFSNGTNWIALSTGVIVAAA